MSSAGVSLGVHINEAVVEQLVQPDAQPVRVRTHTAQQAGQRAVSQEERRTN
jgi:hypothetical protein